MKHLASLLLLLAVAEAVAQPAGADGRASAARPAVTQVFTELLNWQRVNGSARRLAISPGGAILALGREGEAWQWKGRAQWGRLPGSFTRLAIDSTNTPWGLVADGRILRYQGSYWDELPGRASEIAGGADGSVWIIQPDGTPAAWKARERTWQALAVDARLRRLAVAPDGRLWAVAESGGVVRHDGSRWVPLPDIDAADIAIGPGGGVFVAGADGRLLRWDVAGQRWERLNGSVEALAVGPGDRPWIADQEARIWASAFFDGLPDSQVNTTSPAAASHAEHAARLGLAPAPVPAAVVGQPGAGDGAPGGRRDEPLEYRKLDGKARAIAIGADGSVFVATYDGGLARWSNTRNAFVAFPGQFARIAVAPDGRPWGVAATGEVFRHDGSAWQPVRNISAQDIGIGFDGTVIVADTQAFLHRYDPAGGGFVRLPADGSGAPPMGTRVAVTPAGKPWLITGDGFVSRCDQAACERLPVRARSIGIGPEGSVVIVDAERILRRWNERDGGFERIDGIPDLIDLAAVGPRGKPWLLSTASEVWASEFFTRDESRDLRTAGITEARMNTGPAGDTASPPAFTFTVNLPFDKLSALDPPFTTGGELPTVQIAIAPSTGRATLIDANHQFFHYDEAARRLVRDPAIRPAPVLSGDVVRSFLIARDGAYWVSNALFGTKSVWRYQSNQWVEIRGSWTEHNAPITVASAPDGTVYASGPDEQLYRYDGVQRRFVRVTLPLPNGRISSLAIDPNGRFWAGSEGGASGLYEHVGNHWVLRLPSTGPMGLLAQCRDSVHTCFSVGANGSVYTVDTSGSFQRLQRWNAASGTWERLNASPNLALRGVYTVAPDGRPWAIQLLASGSGAGLYRGR